MNSFIILTILCACGLQSNFSCWYNSMLLYLQEWLSPQGRIMLMNKPEDIVTTDAVIVAPKPVLKEPEENHDLASVAHLEFTQCQTAYVGLPGIHEASPSVPVVCSGNTSYTQLPCSVWGIGFEKIDIPSQPEDFLNISHTDSGCSCADLTQSLECRSTESCWCKNWSILKCPKEAADMFHLIPCRRVRVPKK